MFDWVREIADGAAKMSRTKVAVHVDTDCHEVIPNLPLARRIDRNLRRGGPAKIDAAYAAPAKEGPPFLFSLKKGSTLESTR